MNREYRASRLGSNRGRGNELPAPSRSKAIVRDYPPYVTVGLGFGLGCWGRRSSRTAGSHRSCADYYPPHRVREIVERR
jgi:hypothetical protein